MAAHCKQAPAGKRLPPVGWQRRQKSMRWPVIGCVKASRRACSAWRVNPAPARRRTVSSATSGWPMDAMCTRIWWVRPCAAVQRTSSPAPRSRSSSISGARRLAGVAPGPPPPCAGGCADRGRWGHRPRAAPRPVQGRCASARYWRRTSRAAIICTSASMAARVRATTIRPLVSLSSRCTMPARGSRPAGVARQQAVEQGAAPVAGRRVHHQAGGLLMTQQVLVFVHHVQRHRLRHEGLALGRGTQLDGQASPALTRAFRDGLARRAVERDGARLDQLLQVAARELGHQRGQRPVQPLAMQRGAAPTAQLGAAPARLRLAVGVPVRSTAARRGPPI
jgi:hypothetical protein